MEATGENALPYFHKLSPAKTVQATTKKRGTGEKQPNIGFEEVKQTQLYTNNLDDQLVTPQFTPGDFNTAKTFQDQMLSSDIIE